MKKSFLALFLLLTLASQGTWCAAAAAERSHRITGAHLRPHLQVEELHVIEGKKLLEIQVPRKLGQADEHTHNHEVKVPKRMAIAHKGGSTGGGSTGGTTGGASNVNGGPADTRPHTGRKSVAAMPAPAMTTSILALAFSCAIAVSAFSF
uniref:Uncharacterized protein n=1 Tax=Oryza punctata TaxID=4537 RepID=A0A0E0LT34_ORYPU